MSGFIVEHEGAEKNILSFKMNRNGNNMRTSSVWPKKLNGSIRS